MKKRLFYNLLKQLRSVEIDDETFFVVEGDLLMTEEELRIVTEKQLRFFVACQQASDAAEQAVEEEAQQSKPETEV